MNSPVYDPLMLSPRQREVLLMVAEDCSIKEISRRLQISDKTVYLHRAALMERTGCESEIGLLKYAIRYGLVRVEMDRRGEGVGP